MPRPDPSAGPWAELACQLHDELYEPKGRPAVKAMARGMHISTGSVSNVLKGEKGSHWDSLGRSVVRYFGGDSSDTGIWATRWAAAAERQRKRQANDGIEPLPWLDDDEVRQAASEQAVRDWDRNRLAPVTRRWRSRVAVIAAAASVTTAAAIGWWLLATVLLVPLLALMVGPTIVHRARRRADPRSWRRRIILGPVGDRVRDLLRDHDEAPVTQQLVLLDQVTHTEDLTKEMTYPEGTGVLGPYDESGQTLVLVSEAGMGKTTQLALLAQDLIARALATPSTARAVMPFIVDISSYRGEPIDDWLVAAINREYHLHPALVRGMVAGTVPGDDPGHSEVDGIVLLLDGLDEIPESRHRRACADQLRQLRQRCAGLVVTCRTRDLTLARRIEATRYVLIERPSRAAVNRYLTTHATADATAMDDLRAALEADPSLWDLLQSPLWLQLITRTYAGRVGTAVGSVDT